MPKCKSLAEVAGYNFPELAKAFEHFPEILTNNPKSSRLVYSKGTLKNHASPKSTLAHLQVYIFAYVAN